MKNLTIVLCILLVLPAFAEFSRTSGLIDIPTARILPHFGIRAGYDGGFALGSGSRNDGADGNLHMALGLVNKLEVYLDIYTISNFTTAIGFCHRFLENEKLGLAWGIHQISYASDISEIGHGDSVGWYDDLTYYRGDYDKPAELGSAFIIATYALNKSVDATIGFGRGRYCGYGTHSQYFNSNFYHEEGGDWGIGLIAGMDFQINKSLSFIFEGDSRDLNLGFKYRYNIDQYKSIELGLALVKWEFWVTPGSGEFDPRLAASISYIRIPPEKAPGPGIIAGTVFDTDGQPLIAEVGVLHEEMVRGMTDPEQGTYRFPDIDPGMYEVYARAPGYIGSSNKGVKVKLDEITICDFILEKEKPKTGDIIGKVVDLKTDEPLVGQLTIVEIGTSTESESTGVFEFNDLAPSPYKVKAEVTGYETGFYPVEVYAGEITELIIKMVKREMVITLEGIKFDFNKSDIKQEFSPILDEGAAILTNHPEISVEIHGHADSVGTDEYNLELSIARANAVRDYMIVKHNIEPSRLTACGFGENKPVVDNDTEENRAKNRRVEFVIF